MRSIAVFVISLALSGQVLGWGATGHRVAAQIADGYLTPEAKIAVEEILGPETPAEASTWADFMRADPGEFWQETASPWHYVTVPQGKTYEDVGAPEQGDAASAWQRFTYMLRDAETSSEDRALALCRKPGYAPRLISTNCFPDNSWAGFVSPPNVDLH